MSLKITIYLSLPKETIIQLTHFQMNGIVIRGVAKIEPSHLSKSIHKIFA